MWEQNSRYTEFGNSIISRYCGYDTYYDPITLLFPWVHAETGGAEEPPQYINIYQLWYLKEENHIYERKLTFLTNLLEKNIHGYAAVAIGQSPHLKGGQPNTNTESQDGGNGSQIRNEWNHYGFPFYGHWMSRIQTVNKNESYVMRTGATGGNVKGDRSYSPNKNQIQSVHFAHLSQVNHFTKSDIVTKNQILQKKMDGPLEFNSSWMSQNQIVNYIKTANHIKSNSHNANNRFVNQAEIIGGDVTENGNNTENINQSQQNRVDVPLEFNSSWMSQNQTVNKNKNSWYRNESLSYPANLFQVNDMTSRIMIRNHIMTRSHIMTRNPAMAANYIVNKSHNVTKNNIEQTEITDGDVIENRVHRLNINQIQQNKVETSLEFNSHWMSQNQTVNKNVESWYGNKNPTYPATLSQVNHITKSYSMTKRHNTTKNYIMTGNHIVTKDHNVAVNRDYRPDISQGARNREVNLVYGINENGREQEKNRKNQREVIEAQKQVQKEMEFIKETRYEVNQWNQTYQQWENKQKNTEAETLRLNSEQGKRYVQQEAEKVFERQLGESIGQITGRVYRKLEERLKTERDRRGIM